MTVEVVTSCDDLAGRLATVRAGGGTNHRHNLSHWVMLKDNHLTGIDIVGAVESSRSRWPGRTVHVECETLDQVHQSLEAGADALLLDNMTPAQVRACVDEVRAHAATGVDCISSGVLTNAAPALDVGLDLPKAEIPCC